MTMLSRTLALTAVAFAAPMVLAGGMGGSHEIAIQVDETGSSEPSLPCSTSGPDEETVNIEWPSTKKPASLKEQILQSYRSVGSKSINIKSSAAQDLEDFEKEFPGFDDEDDDNVDEDGNQKEVGRLRRCVRSVWKNSVKFLDFVTSFGGSDDDKSSLADDADGEADAWAKMNLAETEKEFNTSVETGLSKEQYTQRLKEYGPNVLDRPKPTPLYKIIIGNMKNFIVGCFIAAIGMKFAMHDYLDAASLLTTLVILVGSSSQPEWECERELAKMDIKKPVPVKVYRSNGDYMEIGSDQLTVGDVLVLGTGAVVPADCLVARVVGTKKLFVTESELTGESKSIEKRVFIPRDDDDKKDPPRVPSNMLLMGSSVESGQCVAVVARTGMRARYGKIQEMLIEHNQKSAPIKDKIDDLIKKFTGQVSCFAFAQAAICFFMGMHPDPSSDQGLAVACLLNAIGLCIAVIPEGLPIACSLAMINTKKKIKQECESEVRQMAAIQSLASVDVFCTDKTGTLTTGNMVVNGVEVPCSNEESLYVDLKDSSDNLHLLQRVMAASKLCNDAKLDTEGVFHGQMVDVALANAAVRFEEADPGFRTDQFQTIITNEFDSSRKMMSAVIRNIDPEGVDLFPSGTASEESKKKAPVDVALVKGAPEKILDVCIEVIDSNGKIRQMSLEDHQHLKARAVKLSSEGFRVLALAYRTIAQGSDPSSPSIEHGLIYVGLVAISDPLRESVPPTIAKLQGAGISARMITGDSVPTAQAIAMQAGILPKGHLPSTSVLVKDCDGIRAVRSKVDKLKLLSKWLWYRERAMERANKSKYTQSDLEQGLLMNDYWVNTADKRITENGKVFYQELIFTHFTLLMNEDNDKADQLMRILGLDHSNLSEDLKSRVYKAVASLFHGKHSNFYRIVKEAKFKVLMVEESKLDDMVEETAVFARAMPEDKVTIVESLQRRGHVVAMTGDGANDAPALKKADAGIAVLSATELTKQAAPINLLSDDFSLVSRLIAAGRICYKNMIKATFNMFAANSGELGPFFLQPLGFPAPLQTLQVLWLNGTTDIFNIVPYAHDPAMDDVMLEMPISTSAPILDRALMRQVYFIGSLTTMGAMLTQVMALKWTVGNYMGRGATRHDVDVASTAVTTFMVQSQLMFSLTCRDLVGTVFSGFRKCFGNKQMNRAVTACAVATMVMPYIPGVPEATRMTPMPPTTILPLATLTAFSLPVGHELYKLGARLARFRPRLPFFGPKIEEIDTTPLLSNDRV